MQNVLCCVYELSGRERRLDRTFSDPLEPPVLHRPLGGVGRSVMQIRSWWKGSRIDRPHMQNRRGRQQAASSIEQAEVDLGWEKRPSMSCLSKQADAGTHGGSVHLSIWDMGSLTLRRWSSPSRSPSATHPRRRARTDSYPKRGTISRKHGARCTLGKWWPPASGQSKLTSSRGATSWQRRVCCFLIGIVGSNPESSWVRLRFQLCRRGSTTLCFGHRVYCVLLRESCRLPSPISKAAGRKSVRLCSFRMLPITGLCGLRLMLDTVPERGSKEDLDQEARTHALTCGSSLS